ncbi:MAG: hypothetical protein M1817_006064 [Caeruleum heppii]|nr:MAG: hypothetical protein M1817_006064 [Caeruleum heppii]
MKTPIVVAASAILLAVASAQPQHARLHAKRAVTYTTVFEEVVTTVDVTTTIYVDATPTSDRPEAAPTTSTEALNVVEAPASSPEAQAGAQFYDQPAPDVNTEPAPIPTTTSSTSEPPVAPSSQAPAYVAPPPSSPESPAPPPAEEPAPVEYAPTPAPAAPTPATEQKSGGGNGGQGGLCSSESNTCGGDLTTYAVGLGSCGTTNSGGEDVVALAAPMMKAVDNGNPNNNPYCGKSIMISYNGKQRAAKIVDTCPGCGAQGLDLSDSLYNFFVFDGRAKGATWWFTD